jgi:hypothetical protein
VIALLVPFALAARPGVGGFLGYESVMNDPFLHRDGLRAGLLFVATPVVEVETSATWFPDRMGDGDSDPDWSRLAEELHDDLGLPPDLSLLTFEQTFVARILPFQTPIGVAGRTGVGAHAGYALVHTHDDLASMQAEGEQSAIDTEKQWHAGPVWGLDGFATFGAFGVRAHLEHMTYIETVNSTTLEHKGNWMFGAEVTLCSH